MRCVSLPQQRAPRPAATAAMLAAAAFATLVTLSGCSPLAAVNRFVPSDAYTLGTAAYGDDPRQRLDIYRPRHMAGTAPVIVFFYGGSWQGGNRDEYRFVGEALAARGIVAVIPDYRVYPQVRYPDFLRDSASAVAWTLREIGAHGGDASRVFVMGHSAGAYNAAMLALDARWLEAAGASPRNLAGWIGLAGPYDFLPISAEDVKPVFDFPDTPADSQPLAHAGARSPPALLVAAHGDAIVDPRRNTAPMAARLTAAGVRVSVHMHDGVGHVTLLGAMAWPLRWLAPVLDEVVAFVESTPAR